jgi:hypothetical protein
VTVGGVIRDLDLISGASSSEEMRNRVVFLPL